MAIELAHSRSGRAGGVFAMAPQSFQELMAFADRLAASGFLPEHFAGKPGAVLAAIQLGSEVGLPPMQALMRIKVIKGMPSIDVRGMLAIVEASGELESKSETWDEETKTATATITRKGRAPVTRTFSMVDAVRAKLTNSEMYTKWPQRMLSRRALGFLLQDEFADIIGGLSTTDYAEDQDEKPVGASATQQAMAATADDWVAALDPSVQQAIHTAFDAVGFTPAQRLVHLNRYRCKEQALIDFLRDEYAVRHGAKRRNGKAITAPAEPAPAVIEQAAEPVATTAVNEPPVTAPVEELPADAINFGGAAKEDA
jgi:hypothetical protein